MRFIGILLMDALTLIMLFFGSRELKGKSAGQVLGIYFLGLVLLFAWSIAFYFAIIIFLRG